MARYKKLNRSRPANIAELIKLQLKGMIESLYMQQASNRWLPVPVKTGSLYGVMLVASMMYSSGKWHLYVTIGDQVFEMEQPEPFWLYKEAMKVLS